jgi:glycosyltransferase involved in cell wall biosynthesis
VRIATEHSMPSIKSRLQRGIDRALAKVTTKIVSVSSAVRDAHIAHEQLDPDKCAVIYNGIDRWDWSDTARREFEDDFRRRCGIPADAPLCIVVGRLEPPKGHDTLLQAVPFILKHLPDARFLLVGDGSLQATLEAQADRLGIRDAIVMLGARTDVRQLLSISDVAINPSHREGFSIAVLEAMAAGLPVVATDVGGNAEAVVSGESGIVVPPGEPEQLAEAVCAILDDRTYAARLGAMASRRFNEHFTLDQMIGSHELLYGGSVAERS